MRALASLALLAAVAGDAAADNPDLDRAWALKSELRYREAAEAVEAARRRGGAEPGELARMWRLAGEIAAGLERRDQAVEHFARWLALEPDAALPDGASPKLSEPFAAARRRLAGRRLSLTWAVDGRRLVVAASDPLSMIAEVRIERTGGEVIARRRAPPYAATIAGTGPASLVAVALDDAGNLLAIAGDIAIAPVAITRPPVEPRPAWARPLPWAIGAGIAGAASVTFGLLALDAQSQLDDLAEQARRDPFSVSFEQFQDARDRGRRRALIANIGFAVTGAAALTAAVLWLTADSPGPVEPAPGGVAVRF